jgi:hypothetical protein
MQQMRDRSVKQYCAQVRQEESRIDNSTTTRRRKMSISHEEEDQTVPKDTPRLPHMITQPSSSTGLLTKPISANVCGPLSIFFLAASSLLRLSEIEGSDPVVSVEPEENAWWGIGGLGNEFVVGIMAGWNAPGDMISPIRGLGLLIICPYPPPPPPASGLGDMKTWPMLGIEGGIC